MPEPTEPETGETVETPEPAPSEEPTDLQAEVEKWKKLSRKNEERARANATAAEELEQLRQKFETDQDRAVREARDAARAEVLSEVSEARVGDAFRVATAGRDLDVDELLEGINPAKFLGDDGNPKTDDIQAWVEKVAPAPISNGFPDLEQGQRQKVPGLASSQLQRDLEAKLGIR